MIPNISEYLGLSQDNPFYYPLSFQGDVPGLWLVGICLVTSFLLLIYAVATPVKRRR